MASSILRLKGSKGSLEQSRKEKWISLEQVSELEAEICFGKCNLRQEESGKFLRLVQVVVRQID